jgi:hypothetical protein
MGNLQFGLMSIGICIALFFGMVLFIEAGRRIGMDQSKKRGPDARAGVGVVDSAVYSLLGLLIGFAFSGAAGRFDKRREMMVHEVNAISTAWLRIDLLPPEAQPLIREAFRRYFDALLSAHDNAAGSPEERRQRSLIARAEQDIWKHTVSASLDPSGEKARVLIMPTMNEMFDVVDEERLAQRLHPPMIIYVMLAITAFAGALLAGFAMSNAPTRNWVHIIGVAATISLASFVILELESPRLGLIRVDAMNSTLIELRHSIEE